MQDSAEILLFESSELIPSLLLEKVGLNKYHVYINYIHLTKAKYDIQWRQT